ncbi:hypothetical protein GCM10007874_44700 [Labrys miyagiensis]|uniref:Uncharacterized protein n=1 Tax=Labrys miyagiensis TaxID=346912 RepID=A0ABQ6CMB3_9HYPH|nr:hypothetical protein [Labrys miyagiensis]GLS21453.1 hypothetical protein GCM10007874_44700 [Labrys miyagiensis]
MGGSTAVAGGHSEPWYGGIDLETGNCIDWFRVDGSVPKIYVVAMSVVACPMLLGFNSHGGNNRYIVSDTVVRYRQSRRPKQSVRTTSINLPTDMSIYAEHQNDQASAQA